jgi:nucleoside phosphorylase/5'-deoxynucleotidase YfbR-like HD superfamily hydrolase/molybdopterin-guanine dinucleotide biosynthesis protein
MSTIFAVVVLGEECDALFNLFELHPIPFPEDTELLQSTLPSASGELNFITWCPQKVGHIAIASEMSRHLQTVQPDLVVNFGLAGGLNDDVSLGDVVLGNIVDSPISNAKAYGDDFRLSGDPQRVTSGVRRCYGILTNAFREKARRTQGPKYNIHVGTIASIPFVLASAKLGDSLRTRDRKYLCVEMESAAVVACLDNPNSPPLDCFIVKGISDLADENKSLLDAVQKGRYRRQALENSAQVLRALIAIKFDGVGEVFPGPSTASRGVAELRATFAAAYRFTRERYLVKRYCEVYERGDSSDVHAIHRLSDLRIENCSVEALVKQYVGHDPEHVLYVVGDSGCGVTTLLQTLYLELYAKGIPCAYIDLSRHALSLQDTPTEAIERIRALVASVRAFDEAPVTLFIDGVDDRNSIRAEHLSLVLEQLEDLSLKLIVGGRIAGTAIEIGESEAKTVVLKPLRPSSPEADEMIVAFGKIFCSGAADGLRKALVILDPPIIDLFMLRLAHRALEEETDINYTSALDVFCRSRIAILLGKQRNPRKRRSALRRAALRAFSDFLRSAQAEELNELTSEEPDELSRLKACALETVHSHEAVQLFLVASHILSEMQKWAKDAMAGETTALPYVFPQTVNMHCKSLLSNRSRSPQCEQLHRELLHASERIVNSDVDDYMKANVCYLLGRFSVPQYQTQAKDILRQVAGKAQTGGKRDRKRLMLIRSAYISLAVLNDLEQTKAYVERLFIEDEWDEFNRGFHLEYYGDERYSPNEPLESADRLEECPNTFYKLERRIEFADLPAMRWINIQTLLSLARHRHRAGRLTEHLRDRFLKLTDKFLVDESIFDELRTFVAVVAAELREQPGAYREKQFWQAYGLKWIKRAGWVERGLPFGESVADHTFGAILIGLFFLPPTQKGSSNEYSKDEVLRILFVHDLAEGKIGDYTPRHNNKDRKRFEERQFFDELGLLDLSGDGFLSTLKRDWLKFEQKTYNGRVARDVDLLENLAQLEAYKHEGFLVTDGAEWAEDIRKLIRQFGTEEGREALRAVESSLYRLNDFFFAHLERLQPEVMEWRRRGLQSPWGAVDL